MDQPDQWTSLSGSLPRSVEQITTKVAPLPKTHTLPAGVGDQLDAAEQMWTDASSAFSSGNLSDAMAGNLSDAMAKANDVKDKFAALRTMLGVKPAAWRTSSATLKPRSPVIGALLFSSSSACSIGRNLGNARHVFELRYHGNA